ncbi:hypothetical protein EDB81DRAFT_934284 [Dactylonectria macrodidyma]|uniref:Uncharacterized protein n=1 Tax=Dactylonectria macrodidyma TaxID=307937 RepID=A0A9P9J2E1_9HYPO|nr:hypothetical protein EDB81DRAFT_934284 [Dactylonectria macrodidyma]
MSTQPPSENKIRKRHQGRSLKGFKHGIMISNHDGIQDGLYGHCYNISTRRYSGVPVHDSPGTTGEHSAGEDGGYNQGYNEGYKEGYTRGYGIGRNNRIAAEYAPDHATQNTQDLKPLPLIQSMTVEINGAVDPTPLITVRNSNIGDSRQVNIIGPVGVSALSPTARKGSSVRSARRSPTLTRVRWRSSLLQHSWTMRRNK